MLDSYDVWPLPWRVSRTEPAICPLTDCASTYGVAGSFVPPTKRIGGAPSTVRGPCLYFGLAGHKPHCRLAYWLHGPKNGDALVYAGPRASYVAMSDDAGQSRQYAEP